MALTISSEPTTEPISLEEAKRHLRRVDSDQDILIIELVASARDYCERRTQRTLRTAVERVLTYPCWPRRGLFIPWPPLISVKAINYFDADDSETELDAADYVVELSTDGGGRVTWAPHVVLPALSTRANPVSVEFTTGYETAAAIPRAAIQAIKTKLTELFGVGTDNQLQAAYECTDRLLSTVDWTGYA